MDSQTLIDKFCNECNKRMVNDGMWKELTPTVTSSNGDIFHVGDYLQTAVRYWNTESVISVLEYTEEYGFMERIFAGKQTKTKPFRWQEIAVLSEKLNCTVSRNCYYNDWGMSRVFYVYGYDGKPKHSYSSWYYHHYDYMDLLMESTLESKHFFRTEMFTLEDAAVLDGSIKYCAWSKDSGIYFMDYVKLYRRYPIGEMLMKLKLYRMINEKAMKNIQENKMFQKWLYKHAEEVRHMAYTTAFNAYKKQPNGDARDYARSLEYRRECGRTLAEADKEMARRLYKYANQEKIIAYLQSNRIGTRSYMDYIRACEWLQLDFSDTKVIFPRNFQEVHDQYTEQYGRWKTEQELIRKLNDAKKEEEALKTLNEILKAKAEEYKFCLWTYEGYMVVMAESKEDLIKEGSSMNNCVGKMGYDRKIERGESAICFIRDIHKPDESLITAEVNIKNLKVAQFYGKGNSVVTPEMQEWKHKWELQIKKNYRKLKKQSKEAA